MQDRKDAIIREINRKDAKNIASIVALCTLIISFFLTNVIIALVISAVAFWLTKKLYALKYRG